MMTERLETIWEQIEAASGSGGLEVRRMGLDVGTSDVYIGIERPGDRRVCLIGLDSVVLRSRLDKIATEGLYIDLAALPQLDPDKVFLGIFLDEADYKDIFTHFISSILGALEAVLVGWKQFLKSARSSLSLEMQRGLYGELCFLEQLIKDHGENLVTSWSGAKATSKDFEFDGSAIEVKATFSTTPQVLKISNLFQLDDTGLNSLYLLHECFEIAQTGAGTLSDKVTLIRKMLEGTSENLQHFNKMLKAYGYVDEDQEMYTENYRLIRSQTYEVTEGFPRLTKQMAPEAVVSAKYEISLGACMPYSRDIETVMGKVLNRDA